MVLLQAGEGGEVGGLKPGGGAGRGDVGHGRGRVARVHPLGLVHVTSHRDPRREQDRAETDFANRCNEILI